jgi:hypothetical protein
MATSRSSTASDPDPARPAAPRGSWALRALALATLAHLGILASGLPILRAILLVWRIPPTFKLPGPLWIAALVAVPTAALWAMLRDSRGHAYKLAGLIALGYALQLALGFSEGRGIDALRDNMVRGVHRSFAVAAGQQDSALEVVREYEALVASGELGPFAASKPPGVMLIYLATQKLASLGDPHAAPELRTERLRTFAAWTWPLLAYLVLLPLYFFARPLIGADAALLACMLYVLVPAVQLMPLHTDQAFFPALHTTSALATAQAYLRRSPLAAVLAGAWLWLSAFCSFPMALGAVFGLAAAYGLAGRAPLDVRRLVRTSALIGATLLGIQLAAALFLDYDVLHRYAAAMDYNYRWQKWDGSFPRAVFWALHNFATIGLVFGLPLTISAALGIAQSLGKLRQAALRPADCVALTLLAVLAFLAAFGDVKTEVFRIWIFLVPMLCLVAADRLATRFGSWRGPQVRAVLALEGLTTLFMKAFSDMAAR